MAPVAPVSRGCFFSQHQKLTPSTDIMKICLSGFEYSSSGHMIFFLLRAEIIFTQCQRFSPSTVCFDTPKEEARRAQRVAQNGRPLSRKGVLERREYTPAIREQERACHLGHETRNYKLQPTTKVGDIKSALPTPAER